MLSISQHQLDALRAAQERGFRRRAWQHVKSDGAALGNPDDGRLITAFDLSEGYVRHWGLFCEQVRMGLLKLAILEGDAPFRDPRFAAIMSDSTRPERLRLRLAAAYLQEVQSTSAAHPQHPRGGR